MRRALSTLALALFLLGCGSAAPWSVGQPFELVTSWEPGSAAGTACRPSWYVVGQLVIDPEGGTAVKVESGDYLATVGETMPVLWWPTFTGRRFGNEVTVLDPDGNVVAMTGRRYFISGSFEEVGFVACGDNVFPEGSFPFGSGGPDPNGVVPS